MLISAMVQMESKNPRHVLLLNTCRVLNEEMPLEKTKMRLEKEVSVVKCIVVMEESRVVRESR